MSIQANLLIGTAMTAAERAAGRYMRAPDEHPVTPPAAPTLNPEPAPAAGGDDDFSRAFEAAAGDANGGMGDGDTGNGGADSGGAGGAGDGTDTANSGDAGAAAPADAGAAAGVAATGEPPAGTDETPPAPAPVTPPAGLSAEDVLSRLAGMMGDKAGAPAAPAAPAAGASADTQAPMYTQEELGVLTDYEKNWPDVSKAETLRRRQEYHQMLQYVFSEVAAYVTPLFDQVKTMGNSLHMGELTQKVPDYSDDLEQQVGTWIDTQPSYLQPAYKQVMQGGTSDEVADLIGRYKASAGITPATPKAAPAAPAAPSAVPAVPAGAPKTELSSAAKQAAESLAPVSGERSQVPQSEDTGDFDSAFKKYATTME